MDEDVNNLPIENLRIDECEVCSSNVAKYTCPSCELRTCSLDCVKIHKKELDCSGIRNRVKFKMLKNFDNIDFLSDYRLLEETARIVSKPGILPAVSCYSAKTGNLPSDLYRLKCTALSRGVQLYYLPPSFSRHISNTSYLDHATQRLYWRIDWIFVHAENTTFTDERVLDSSLISACVHKYIEPEEQGHPSLSFYQAAGHSGIKLLLKAERHASNRYFTLDPTTTVRENLYGKSVIEYPVIYVILSDHIYMYDIIKEDHFKRRKRKYGKANQSRPTNFLFPKCNDAEEVESNDEMSGTESTCNVGGTNDNSYKKPYNRHRNFGYYRGRRMQNCFRNNWNRRHYNRNQQFTYSYSEYGNDFQQR